MENIFAILIIFVFGLFFGSFLNVVALRTLKDENFITTPSHCTSCNTKLKPWDLVPVFSWLFLRGKCRYCKEKVSYIYPIGEILTAISYTLMFYMYGLSIDFFINVVFITFMILATVTDMKAQIVPDKITLIGFIFVFILRIVEWNNLLAHIIGAVISFIFLIVVFLLSGGKLGGADIKIYALIGLSVGAINSITSLFYASMIGVILTIPMMMKSRSIKGIEIPFIPFITLGVLATYVINVFSLISLVGGV